MRHIPPLRLALAGLLLTPITAPAPALAYKLSGDGCDANGKECKVYCDNGSLAGSRYWNGSVWTDGQKWDADKDAEAKKICAANGSACK